MDIHSLVDEVQGIIVSAARDELLPRFACVERTHKRDGSILTEADTAMQTRIAGKLQQLSPDILFLGEEMEADEQAGLLESGQPVWCLDPLDGTSNFACGIPYYCVALALLHKGHVELGLVYDPVRDECFSAVQGEGARLDGKPLQVSRVRAGARPGNGADRFKAPGCRAGNTAGDRYAVRLATQLRFSGA